MNAAAGAFRLVVFDWDGTLIDSIASIVGCTRCAFEELGLPAPPEEQIRGAIGLGLGDTMRRFFPDAGADLRQRVREAYGRHWVGTWHARHAPFPPAETTLAHLERAGYLLAVATAKSRRGLERDFERTGLGRYFAASRTTDEAAAKPSPAMVLELMRELGAGADATLVVGDTSWDLEMAAAAGAAAVAVCCGAQDRQQLLRCRPLALLDGVHELPRWLAERGGAAAPCPAAQGGVSGSG
ncbi:MAG TPA: HAD-IA family hydrolase [Thermoanaerobaculia bacterium]|nr:HAD-IA family hydrolase [Thermoanaerobaculia bacterium]